MPGNVRTDHAPPLTPRGPLHDPGSTAGLGANSLSGGVSLETIVNGRGRVDWPIIFGPKVPVRTVVDRSARGQLAALLTAFDELLALENSDAIVRRAVELARE